MDTYTAERCERSSPVATSRNCTLSCLWNRLAFLVAFTAFVGVLKLDPVFGRLNSVVDLTAVSVALMIGIAIVAVLAYRRLPRPAISDLLVVSIFLCILVGARDVSNPYSVVKVATFGLVSLPLYLAARMIPVHISSVHISSSLMAVGMYVQVMTVMFGEWVGSRLIRGAGTQYLSIGYVAGCTAILAWVRRYEEEATTHRLALWLVFMFSLMIILSSAARGPFGALVLLLVLFEFLTRQRGKRTFAGILASVVVLAFIAGSSVSAPMKARFGALVVNDSVTLSTRTPLFSAAVYTIRSNPAGVGTGNFASLVGTSGRDYPHNILLEMGAENGWFGLLVVLLLAILNTRYAIVLIRRGVGIPIAVIFLFALASAMLSGDMNDQRLLWVSIGAMQRIVVQEGI